MNTITRRTGLAVLAPLAALALTPALTFAQEADESADAGAHRARVAQRYDFESWTSGAVRIGLAIDLELAGWASGPLDADEGYLTRSFHDPAARERGTAFVLESHVADSAAAAHEDLLTWLAGLQSPHTMPPVTELGFAVGDVGFFGRSGAASDAQAWVAFVRGNVAVRLVAFDPRRDPGLDLGGIAREIDLALLETQALPAAEALPRPVVRALSLERAQVEAGERVRVDVDVLDPHGGAPHLRWTVGGAGLGYVERGQDGALYLYTTGPGEIELILEATGSTGTFVRESVRVSVTDD